MLKIKLLLHHYNKSVYIILLIKKNVIPTNLNYTLFITKCYKK